MVTSALTCAEAAILSGYHQSHVRLLCRKGSIKCEKEGRSYSVDRKSLLEYVKYPPKRGPKPEHN